MKGFIKGVAGVAAVLFAIGLGALLLGVFTGGRFVNVPLGNTGFNIFAGLNNGSGFDFFDDFFDYDNNEYSQNNISNGKAIVYTVPEDTTIDELKFEVGAANFEIVYGDEFKFESEGKYKYNSVVSGSVWKIEMKGKNFLSGASEKVKITLPENISFKKVEFDFGAGNFNIDSGITADVLDIEMGAGNLTGSNFIINKKTKISCGASNVEINGNFNGKNDFECGVGRLVLNYEEKPEDFGYSVEMGLGHVKIFDESFGGIADRQFNTDADVYFDIECGVGSLEIN